MKRLIALAAVVVLVVGGCTADSDDPERGDGGGAGPAGVLRVLAGSELQDLEPMLDEVRRATGVQVKLTYTGTLDGVERVYTGAAAMDTDAIWFSSNRYLELHGDAIDKISTQTKVMSSPVILGVRSAQAAELGWDKRRPTWKEIAEAGASGRFTYGMTNPAASNSGFSALVAAASALADAGTALTGDQVRQVGPQLTAFFKGQAFAAGSSGWLADAFKQRTDVSGLINYESVLLSMKAQGVDITLVHPSDGVVTADYPLTLLAGVPTDVRDRYQRVVDYLRRDDVQRKIVERTNRRPVVAAAAPADRFVGPLVELPFPVRLDVADALIGAYLNTLRRAPRTLYVLDLSGSMAGDRIDKLKAAMTALTGADTSLSGRFSRFSNREQVLLVPFSSRPNAVQRYEVPAENPEAELNRIRGAVQALKVGGDTAIYDALATAYDEARKLIAADPSRFTTIVLLTDGVRTAGRDLDAFTSTVGDPKIPVFPVLFGESVVAEMDEVARVTGGKVFDGRSGSLQEVFKEIRGYQ
ncbi:VWA domain-containing protein [Virgisporangium aurantiacum]|uniref:VWA domain-containing protein n=1 Tax=Virgisporangium aurantiacum TaxID=175570 RepID=A0A8J3ZDR3_9ACTN|nr:VWA domain-containing protein [Virgisporangium aurantiacum]GIJ59955.1 VWA domain-containing protein [Virgisporangium aurantiacum]